MLPILPCPRDWCGGAAVVCPPGRWVLRPSLGGNRHLAPAAARPRRVRRDVESVVLCGLRGRTFMRLLRRFAASLSLAGRSGRFGRARPGGPAVPRPPRCSRAQPGRWPRRPIRRATRSPRWSRRRLRRAARVTFAVSCASLERRPRPPSSARPWACRSRSRWTPGTAGGVFTITVTLPASILPGVYHPDIDCSDGTSATAPLRITAFPTSGGAQTGDGTTSTATNNGLAAGGLVLIGIGAVAGGIALRRRSASTPAAPEVRRRGRRPQQRWRERLPPAPLSAPVGQVRPVTRADTTASSTATSRATRRLEALSSRPCFSAVFAEAPR